MYADTITDSMRSAIDETRRRREIQQAYNEAHGITPTSIKKAVRDLISISRSEEEPIRGVKLEKEPESMSEKELMKLIMEVQKKMQRAAAELDFEQAAVLRDQMMELKKYLYEMDK